MTANRFSSAVILRVNVQTPARVGILPAALAATAFLVGVVTSALAEPASSPTVAPTAPSESPLYVPPEDSRDLIRLDDSIRTYFRDRVSADRGSLRRLQQIIDAIVEPSGLKFAYDGAATLDVREAFRARRGNCVTFALLLVAVAREFGFEASFQNVDTAARWSRWGNIVVSVMHLNARVYTDDGTYVIDLRRDLVPNVSLSAMEEIKDHRAFSEFYCDVGFFRLVHGRPADAMHYMTLATEVDPDYAEAWSNCANLHARSGDLARARANYERALATDQKDLGAIVGLAEVLKRIGTPEALAAAQKYGRRADAIRSRNPYAQEYFASQAQAKDDWIGAEKLLRRAIALKDDEPAFYVQWIAALRHLGRESDAQRAERKLHRLQARLAAELADAQSGF